MPIISVQVIFESMDLVVALPLNQLLNPIITICVVLITLLDIILIRIMELVSDIICHLPRCMHNGFLADT